MEDYKSPETDNPETMNMFNKLNPAVIDGLKRTLSKLDEQAPDFKEKVGNILRKLLEMQYKDFIPDWKKANEGKQITKDEKLECLEKIIDIAIETIGGIKRFVFKISY